MKRWLMLSLLFAGGVLRTARAEIVVGDDHYLSQVRQQWLELVAPNASFAPVCVLLIALSIVVVARFARLKTVPIFSPSFLVPPLFLAFVLWFFMHVPVVFAGMYGDFGVPFRDVTLWVRFAFAFGARWYGPAIICAAWVATHPIVLRPCGGVSRGRRVLLFLPGIGVMLLLIAWFVVVGVSPVSRMS